jgi:protein arginine N-methyltransferase 1
MRIEYHRTLVADRVRNKAFHDALASVIKKGETTVADIGAGTGLIGLMAAKLGAREVYLYEAREVARVAAAVLKASRVKGCRLMPCHSREIEDPPQVDVVVSETLGNYALEENIVDTLADAQRRHLKKGGVVIPRRIEQTVAPVVSDRIHRELTVWDEVGYGLDLAAARTMSLNNIYVRTLEPGELLAAGRSAKVWDVVALGSDKRASRKGAASWMMTSPVAVYGFACWWVAELVPGISLSTAPDAPRTHWEQLYFPLLEPIAGKAGETITLLLRSRSSEAAGTHLAWTAIHADRKGKTLSRQALDLDKGWLP